MSVYEYVETALWSDPVFGQLKPHAKLLYVWSFTNPRCNIVGIYKVGRPQMSVETGITPRRLQESLDELANAHLVFYDDTYIFVRARVKYLHGKSPNTAKGIRHELAKLDIRHAFTQAFLFLYQDTDWDQLRDILGGFETPSSNPLLNGFCEGATKGLARGLKGVQQF